MRPITVITIQRQDTGWTATFRNCDGMPCGVPLPLPFFREVDPELVRVDLRRRFPGCSIVTKRGSRFAI